MSLITRGNAVQVFPMSLVREEIKHLILLGILVFIFFLKADVSLAADYYIDATNGLDTNAGTSQGEAWKTINKLNTSTFQPGDNIYFKRGEQWREQLNVPSSGAENNPITFSAYDSGALPVINGSNIMTDWEVESGNVYKKTGIGASVAFVAIDGVMGNYQSSLVGVDSENDWYYDATGHILYVYSSTDPVGKTIEAGQRSAAIYINAKDYISIENLYFKNFNSMGIWGDEPLTDVTVDSCGFGQGGNSGTGYRKVYFEGYNDESNRQMDYITVSNCTLDDSVGNFYFQYVENLTVNNNDFSLADIHSHKSDTVTISNNTALFISAQGTDNATISGNTIVGTQYVGPADDCGINIEDRSVNADVNNIVIEDNDISECDYTGIWTATDQPGYKLNGLIVRRNHVSQSGLTRGNSGGIMIWYDAQNIQIYDNIFEGNGIVDGAYAGGILLYPHPSHYIDTVKIYNNTLYDNNGAQLRLLSESANDSITNVDVKNNVFYSTDDECLDADSGAASHASNSYDYNLYYRSSGDILKWGSNTYTLAQFANFKSTENEEAHGLAIDPLFVNAASNDYSLQYLSPAIEAGTNISLNADYLNNPLYALPDLGVYEYQPPYTMGADEITTSAPVRTYGNEKFRNKVAPTGIETADLSVAIPGADTSQWLDISVSIWSNTDSRHKNWTETTTFSNITNTVHSVGDLQASEYYLVKVDSVAGQNITGTSCTSGVCQSDSQGKINFTYTGTYSAHTFDVEQTNNTEDTDEPSVDPDAHATSSSTTTLSLPNIFANQRKIKFNRSTTYIKKDDYKLKGKSKSIANGTVKVYKDNKLEETAKVDKKGKWSVWLKDQSDKKDHKNTYILKIKYYDQSGKLVASYKRRVRVDTEDPIITSPISNRAVVYAGRTRVYFKAVDNDRLDKYKLSLDGKIINLKVTKKTQHQIQSYLIPAFLTKGQHFLIVKAVDKAGNDSEKKITLHVR